MEKAAAFTLAFSLAAAAMPANVKSAGIFKRASITVHAEEENNVFSGVSLTLADDLALNFYVDGIDESNKESYSVQFSGKCVEESSDKTCELK